MCVIPFTPADEMSCTCRRCRLVMTMPQIVSGQKLRYVLVVTDRLIAEPQSGPAYLGRVLVPIAPNIKLSAVKPREIQRPTVPGIILIYHKASISQHTSRSISKFYQCDSHSEAKLRVYFQYKLNFY